MLLLFLSFVVVVVVDNICFFCQGYELSGEIALKNNHYYYYYYHMQMWHIVYMCLVSHAIYYINICFNVYVLNNFFHGVVNFELRVCF